MMPANVTLLLEAMRRGDLAAQSELMPVLYDELHRLAHHYMRNERPDHTLQATALVNEAYLKLIDQSQSTWQSKAHFMAVAATIMRHLLVDHARGRLAGKRGGFAERVPLHPELDVSDEQTEEWMDLDEALKKLNAIDPRQSRIVELRYFGGLSVEDTAEVLDVSPKTVKRDWSVARAWLRREIGRREQ